MDMPSYGTSYMEQQQIEVNSDPYFYQFFIGDSVDNLSDREH